MASYNRRPLTCSLNGLDGNGRIALIPDTILTAFVP